MTPHTHRRVVILGSTGSIGRQAIDVIRAHPQRFELVGIVAGSDSDALEAQAQELGLTRRGLGSDAAADMAALDEADVVLNAVVGAAGLASSLAALSAGKTLALANKESLVAGGELCMRAAEDGGGRIVPVDSEHAALAQCLRGVHTSEIARIVLTASGGPFRRRADLGHVTRDEALAHPTWSMGPKVTIDSATMMNKGLEVIEAHFLFGLDYDRIGVIVHPQSVVHAIVELLDASSLMQAAPADMRIPIQAALGYPERFESLGKRVDLAEVATLDFEEVDDERFPAVRLAYEAGREGGSAPAALNAANEEAVHAFLNEQISFVDIPSVIEDVLADHVPADIMELADVLEVDGAARRAAQRAIEHRGMGR